MVPKNFKFYEIEEAYYEWDSDSDCMKITYIIQVKDSSLKPLYKITRNSIVYRRDINKIYE